MPMTFSTLTVTLTSGAAATEAVFDVHPPGGGIAEVFKTDIITLPAVVPPLRTQENLATSAYTRALSSAVLGGEHGSKALLKARTVADTLHLPLRVRVSVGGDDGLARHHWELLADPENDFKPFAWGERSCFSRYLPSPKERALPLASSHVRSVALLANPTDLTMDAIDAAAVKAVVNEALGSTHMRRLYGARASFEGLKRELREGVDVLVLTCHGRLTGGTPNLYFEKEGQRADVVDANDLAMRIGEMYPPPRLVVMVSCDSAGAGDPTFRDDGGFFASAAAAFVKAGVPAVIGMQGAVAQETGLKFLKAFCRHLLEHGHVEAATAAARMEIPRKADWWVASLLLSVDDGVLWAGGPPREFPHWDELLDALDLKECSAILGSEIIERLSNRALAEFFLGRLDYPPRPGSPRDLARISQQLKVEKDRERPGQLLRAFYRRVQTEDGFPTEDADLPRSVSAWGRRTLEETEFNSYRELAELPVALYITTNPDDLLADALRAAGKTPQTLVCPWKNENPGQLEVPALTPPTVATPVVYQLFGHLSEPNSVVLTEDDFFDHLIWMTRHSARTVPPSIPSQLAKTSLLFLGFQLEDWEFRVLLRGLVKMQMVNMFAGRLHVAVQLDPSDLTPEQQNNAVRALQNHFRGTEVKLEIYWGNVELFLRQLRYERARRMAPVVARAGQA